MIAITTYNLERTLPELKKLRGFFESAMKETRDDAVLGHFGPISIFYGNVISCCDFEIPASAMKLIYEHNREKINQDILTLETELTRLKKSL